MAISDYIPNVFGTNPSGMEGLLGSEQAQQLGKQSNIAGLLGAAAALSQGMSSQGYRRSGLQNILSALGAGYGASGQAYQQGIQNLSSQQQILANQQKQAAFEAAAKKYPDLAPLARLDPGKFVEMVTQLEKQKPITEAYRKAGIEEPQQQQVSPEMAPYLVSATPEVKVTPSAQPLPSTGDQQMMQGNAVVTAPVPTEAGYQPLPQQQVVNPMETKLSKQKETLLNANAYLNQIGTKEANDEIINNLKSIEGIDKQLDRLTVSGFDFNAIKKDLPSEYHARVDALKQLASKGAISGNELRSGLNEIANAAQLKSSDIQEYNFAVKQGFKGSLQDWLRQIKPLGATNIMVGDKVLAGERAKAQSKAEENAINAQNSASDVRAIVDILKPYRGGAWQDFAGQVGAYLPGTKLEQLATAKQTAEAIRSKLAPTLRVEGSGATSDFETKSFLAAIPSLFNTAQGRELMAVYAEKLANRSAAAADIRAQLVEQGTYSIKRFQQEMAKAGLNQVFTAEELQTLRGNQAAQGGGANLSSPEAQRAFDKYKPR
jgi:flagellar protein FlgJ